MDDPHATSREGMSLVTKADKVIRVLEEHGELTVKSLAGLTGEPASSLYRLVANLETLRWLDPGQQRGTYRLGLKLLRLGHSVESQLNLREIAAAELQSLRDSTGETSFLCVRRDQFAVCIDRRDGLNIQLHRLQVGDSMPLGQGAAPRVLLAFESEQVVDHYLEHMPLDGRFGAPAVQAEQLIQQLNQIKHDGVSVSESGLGEGIGGVGAPVFNWRGEIVAAISLCGLSATLFPQEGTRGHHDPVALVQEAASRISSRLGWEAHHRT